MGVSYANCKNIQQETKHYDFRLKTWSTDIVHFKNVTCGYEIRNIQSKEGILLGKKWKVLVL